jgi:hypothetical protein
MDELKAGRELDALIAEKVMGLRVVGRAKAETFECKDDYLIIAEGGDEPVFLSQGRCMCEDDEGLPGFPASEELHLFGHLRYCLDVVLHYSTDIAAAWQVIEKIRLGNSMMIDVSCGNGRLGWRCYIRVFEKRADGHDREAFETANTAPLAICRAILRAIGE